MSGQIFTGCSYLIGVLVFILCARQKKLSPMNTLWLTAAGLTGGVLGAKIMRIAFASASGANPLILMAHPDGKTIIGGILGGWIAVEVAKMMLKIKRSTGDCFALALPLGEAIGRIGCFLSGCCYGSPCSLPWSIYQHGHLRHPAQIYSLAVSLSIFAFLLYMQKRTTRDGDLFRIYLILWAGSRFLLEFVRERTDIFFGLSLAQWVCLEVSVTVLIAMGFAHRMHKKSRKSVSLDSPEGAA